MDRRPASQPQSTRAALKTRWGQAVRGRRHGFVIVPHALLRYQGAFGLTDGELVVALHLLMHWNLKEPENRPFVSAARVAKRMKASPRTVQRHLRGLVRKGFIERLTPEETSSGVRRRFDLRGLVREVRRSAGETIEVPAVEPAVAGSGAKGKAVRAHA